VSELTFYEGLVKKYGEPVLELGCNTAYLLIPMARKGIEVVGIDISKTLLDYAHKKLVKEPPEVRNKITLIEGDICDVKLDRNFRVIYITPGTFTALLTQEEQIKMLKQVRKWLHPEGVFVLETEVPYYKLQGWGGYKGDLRLTWTKYIPELGKTVYLWETRTWDHFTQIAVWRGIEDLVDEKGNIERRYNTGRCRYTNPSEIELLLKLTEFEVIDRFGDVDRRPFGSDSEWVLYLTRKTT